MSLAAELTSTVRRLRHNPAVVTFLTGGTLPNMLVETVSVPRGWTSSDPPTYPGPPTHVTFSVIRGFHHGGSPGHITHRSLPIVPPARTGIATDATTARTPLHCVPRPAARPTEPTSGRHRSVPHGDVWPPVCEAWPLHPGNNSEHTHASVHNPIQRGGFEGTH